MGLLQDATVTEKRSMRHGLRRRQSEYGRPDAGPWLDDMEKFGKALKWIVGPSGSLDPLDLGGLASYDDFADGYTYELTPNEENPEVQENPADPESEGYIEEPTIEDESFEEVADPESEE